MSHIFISYSSKHRLFAEQLSVLLSAEGYLVWWDYALESWSSYQSQIDAALVTAAAVVVIWSEGAAESVYVKAEANKALAAGKLVNVRPPAFPVSAVPSPYNALHIDTLDLAEPHRLLRSIRRVWSGKAHLTAKPLYEHYAETFGVNLFDPKRTRFERDWGGLAPSDLLLARNEAVTYIDATGLRQEMLAWCRDGIRNTSGMLIHGPGGYGKTRLLTDTARLLRNEDWLAGFLAAPRCPDDQQEIRQREQALVQAFALGEEPGVLVIVDYAENRQDEVATIARLLAGRQTVQAKPVRLVLIARSDQWWPDFMARDYVAAVFRAAGKPAGEIRALTSIPKGRPRTDFFIESVSAFEPIMTAMANAGTFPSWNRKPPSQRRMIHLMEDPGFGRPLTIQMEALLYLASSLPDAGTLGVDSLLDAVLTLEQLHWRKLLGPLDDDRRRDLERGVAQVTAVQGVSDINDVQALLKKDRFFEGRRVAPVDVDRVLRDLLLIYGRSDGTVAQLEPDLIGEHAIISITRNALELIDGCILWITELPEATQSKYRRNLLTVLQRATSPVHGEACRHRAGQLLLHLVRSQMSKLAPEFVGVIVETPGDALSLLTESIPSLDSSALAALDAALPRDSVALVEVAYAVASQRVVLAKEALAASDNFQHQPEGTSETAGFEIPDLVISLGVRLAKLGRLEDALEAAKEAISICRVLSEVEPEMHRAVLARSLSNLALVLGNLDQFDASLAASKEAVANYRILAVEKPNAFTSDLAWSLRNMGLSLSNLGRRQQAVTVTNESVAISRNLVATDAERFQSELAAGLVSLGWMYCGIEQPDAAHDAIEEAIVQYRALSGKNPDAFLPGLAQSLSSLSWVLLELGRHNLALDATHEAIATFRSLAEARPDIYIPQLAASLNMKSDVLAAIECWPEAAAIANEALQTLIPYLERSPTTTQSEIGAMIVSNVFAYSSAAGCSPDAHLLMRAEVALSR